VSNSALATAQNPQGTDITDISGTTISTDDSTIVDISPKPSIAITADGVYVDTNGDGITNVGDHIRYNYVC
jgi:hypothetical protein